MLVKGALEILEKFLLENFSLRQKRFEEEKLFMANNNFRLDGTLKIF